LFGIGPGGTHPRARTTAATTEVTSGFDVDIQLQQPIGATPVPVVPRGARNRDAGD
jgi:hypothetical protein